MLIFASVQFHLLQPWWKFKTEDNLREMKNEMTDAAEEAPETEAGADKFSWDNERVSSG